MDNEETLDAVRAVESVSLVQEGLALLAAFHVIECPEVRQSIVQLVQMIAATAAVDLPTALL